MNREEKRERPSAAQLAAEIERNESRTKFSQALRSTIYILITVAAIAVLISTLLFPVMKTYGSSMTPTIEDGEILADCPGKGLLILLGVTTSDTDDDGQQ